MDERVGDANDGWPEPRPITDAQKTGEQFLVWERRMKKWIIVQWDAVEEFWSVGLLPIGAHMIVLSDRITHYVPLPPDVEP